MLKTAIVALTIVGCDCDAKMCEYIRGEQPQWSTMAECETALKGRIVRDRHENYPLVIAVCSVPDENSRALAQAAFDEAVTAQPVVMPLAEDSRPTRIETIVGGGRALVSRTGDRFATATGTVRRAARDTFSLVAVSVGSVADAAVSKVKSAW